MDKSQEEKKIESMFRGIITLCKKSIDSDSALITLKKASEKYAKLLGISFAKKICKKIEEMRIWNKLEQF